MAKESKDLTVDDMALQTAKTRKVTIKKVTGIPSMATTEEEVQKSNRNGHRKKYNPTSDDFKKVECMSDMGIDRNSIAKIMGISGRTLTKYFKKELELSSEKRNARVAGIAYEMAMSGDSPSMTTFWLKTRAGWTPKNHLVVEDKNYDISWSDDAPDISDHSQEKNPDREVVH